MTTVKVLVTDAGYKHSLAAIRSLARSGHFIIGGDTSRFALSFHSKYCKERIVYPNPKMEESFFKFFSKYLKRTKVAVLIPIGYLSNVVFAKYQKQLRSFVEIPIANWKAMRIASNKDETMELAKQLGVRVPRIYRKPSEVTNFPIVMKGIRESGFVRYVNSANELAKINVSDSILQEYIPGDGYGFFALYNNGKSRAFFMHKRIREYPITGGPSTSAISTYNEELRTLGEKLLDALNWHGVAMVEFKKDLRDGKFTLMEINPKFWGSLDLSIASGVDFPRLLVKMAFDGDIKPVTQYNIGLKFQWPLPDDFLHFLANPVSIREVARDLFDRQVKNNIDLGDIKPNLYQSYLSIRRILYYIRKKKLRFPNGYLRS